MPYTQTSEKYNQINCKLWFPQIFREKGANQLIVDPKHLNFQRHLWLKYNWAIERDSSNIKIFYASKILPNRSVKILKFHWSNFNIAFSTFDCWCECSQLIIIMLGQCSNCISQSFSSQSAIELRCNFVISYKNPRFPTQRLCSQFQTLFLVWTNFLKG